MRNKASGGLQRRGRGLWHRLPDGLTGRATAFGRDTRASVTVEFVMWVPVFCGLLMLFADHDAR